MGITDPDEKAALGVLTRDSKIKNLSFDELRTTWLSWLSPDESDTIQKIELRKVPIANIELDQPQIAKEAIKYAADHHFVRESVISERKLLTTALLHSIGETTPESVLDPQYLDGFIRGEQNGQDLVTTQEVLEEEQRMLKYARDGKGTVDPLIPAESILTPEWFNNDQKQALHHLCTSTDNVMLLRGVAGAGKTTLLSELRKQTHASGKELLAFAPSAEASQKVLKEAGFENADTVAMLLKNPKLHPQLDNQIILIDEAGQLGSRPMSQVFELAKQHNARIILSGDRNQHKSVDRGSALRLLEDETGLKSAKLTEIMRQKDRYKQASAYLSQGRVEPAFKILDQMNWIHELDDPTTRYQRIAAEYLQATEAKKSVLVISPTHIESDRVTHAIRDALKHEGKIGQVQSSILKLTNRNLTPAQLHDKVNYTNGDIVIFDQNAKGYTKGTRLTVGTDPIPLELANRFSLFLQSELSVSTGDLIRITGNGQTADGHRINNGQLYTIQSIKEDGTLVFNNGWHLGPDYGKLDYGYCGTSHASQGKTHDRVIIAESSASFPAASKEQFYVSVSRGRSICSIYTDDKHGLLEAVQESSDQTTATELAANAKVYQRLRQHSIDQSIQPHTIPIQTREQLTHER